jgi:hypothetical protein
LSAAFLVADAVWQRRGEIAAVLERQAASGMGAIHPALLFDLTRAVLHDQEYELGFALAMFGAPLIWAVAVEEAAAAAAASSLASRAPLALRSHPVASTVALTAAYIAWVAGKPLARDFGYRRNREEAERRWAEFTGERPAGTSIGDRIDRIAGFTVGGSAVPRDRREHALLRYFELQDAARRHWVDDFREVRRGFAEYVGEARAHIAAQTVASHCYRATDAVLAGGGREAVERYIRRRVAPDVLRSPPLELDNLSYSDLAREAARRNLNLRDYAQDRYASASLAPDPTDGSFEAGEKRCLAGLSNADLTDPGLLRDLELRQVSLELQGEFRWADFVSRPGGLETWTGRIARIGGRSLAELRSLFEKEGRRLRERLERDSFAASRLRDRIARLEEVHSVLVNLPDPT